MNTRNTSDVLLLKQATKNNFYPTFTSCLSHRNSPYETPHKGQNDNIFADVKMNHRTDDKLSQWFSVGDVAANLIKRDRGASR